MPESDAPLMWVSFMFVDFEGIEAYTKNLPECALCLIMANGVS